MPQGRLSLRSEESFSPAVMTLIVTGKIPRKTWD
jgi:hypothetical protein